MNALLPDAFECREPTTPIWEIPRPAVSSEELVDFPFQMGEVAHLLTCIRRSSRRYVEQVDEIRRKARRFREEVIQPVALEIEKKISADPSYFASDVMAKACEYKLFSVLIPKEFGGGGYRSLHLGVMAEELATGCAGLASTIGVHSGALSCGVVAADLYLMERYIRPIVAAERRGEPILWAGAVTEPSAGTDIWDKQFLQKGSIGTHVRRTEGGYIINGRKCFVSNGSVADLVVVAGALDPRDVANSWSLFLIPLDSKGVEIGRIEKKMGQKSSPASELIFDEVFVPNHRLIGLEGAASRYVSIYLAGSRGPVGAIGVGCARRALECFADWARQKRVGGARLIDQQWVQMRLSEMAREIATARNMYVVSALLCDQIFSKILDRPLVKLALNLIPGRLVRTGLGRAVAQSRSVKKLMWGLLSQAADDHTLAHIAGFAAMAKVIGSDAGVRVSGEVMRIMGHDAFDPRWPVEKAYRDAKLTQIYEGTNQANAITQFKSMAGTWSQLAGVNTDEGR